MEKGQLVRTWWNSGARMGGGWLYGIVEQSGPKRYLVMWESGLCNRPLHANPNVTAISDEAAMEATGDNIRRKLACTARIGGKGNLMDLADKRGDIVYNDCLAMHPEGVLEKDMVKELSIPHTFLIAGLRNLVFRGKAKTDGAKWFPMIS